MGLTMRFRVTVDSDKCNGCGDCLKSCAYGVLEIIDNTAYAVNVENCKGCRDCLQECKVEAIRVIHT
jgi:NAD-dependent dihydropyrimidine dehydrogenase PreA subunit